MRAVGRTGAQHVERTPGRDDVAEGEGRVLRAFRRQALHAALLGFVHPITGEALRFETDPPKDMARLIAFLRLL